MKKNNTTADMQINQLQQDIKRLSDELAASERLTDYYCDSYETAEKERIACRRLIKYHTLVLIIMNLVSRYTSNNDMGEVIETCINSYYKELTAALMNIPGDDSIDNFEDNEFGNEE